MLLGQQNRTFNPAGSPKIIDTTASKQSDVQWDRFREFVKNIAAVPKEEVDELRAKREREKKEA